MSSIMKQFVKSDGSLHDVWTPVKDYENYMIHSYGKIGKKDKNGNIKELKLKLHNSVYSINLCKNGNKKTFNIHRLVAINFVNKNMKNDNDLLTNVIHKDNNVLNNRADNLEWDFSHIYKKQ